MKFNCLDIESATAFEWNAGNIEKNEIKHKVKWNLIEELFFNEPLLIAEDVKHSQYECRCFALGQTDEGMLLYVAFTLRAKKIRVISVRPMNKKERRIYEGA